jgi:hypothetical protein
MDSKTDMFFYGIITGGISAFILLVVFMRLTLLPSPKIIGYPEVGYFVKYDNKVYRLSVPQTADQAERVADSTQQPRRATGN